MNSAHLHLILVHVPIVLVPIGLLILAFGHWRKDRSTTQVAYFLFIIAAIFVIPAFLLGEGAEEAVEHLSGVSEDLIEEHEEAADFALWLTIGLGVLSLGGAFFAQKGSPLLRSTTVTTMVLSIVTIGALVNTAQRGGMIRHPEAYDKGVQSESSDGSGDVKLRHQEEKDDDD